LKEFVISKYDAFFLEPSQSDEEFLCVQVRMKTVVTTAY